VGKTTIMQGCVNVIRRLTDHILALYHDYQKEAWVLPFDKVTDSIGLPKEESAEELLQAVWNKGYHVAFFADEIQELYVENGRLVLFFNS
jgi:hypothetical protein